MKDQTCCKFRFFIPLIIVAALAALSLAVYELWNHVLAEVLEVKLITYWQALGLLVLARILFGSFPCRRGGPCGPPWRRHPMMEHWHSLPPEQREEIRRRFGDSPPSSCCGSHPGEEKPPDNPANASVR
jgi:hypothetical protein